MGMSNKYIYETTRIAATFSIEVFVMVCFLFDRCQSLSMDCKDDVYILNSWSRSKNKVIIIITISRDSFITELNNSIQLWLLFFLSSLSDG